MAEAQRRFRLCIYGCVQRAKSWPVRGEFLKKLAPAQKIEEIALIVICLAHDSTCPGKALAALEALKGPVFVGFHAVRGIANPQNDAEFKKVYRTPVFFLLL